MVVSAAIPCIAIRAAAAAAAIVAMAVAKVVAAAAAVATAATVVVATPMAVAAAVAFSALVPVNTLTQQEAPIMNQMDMAAAVWAAQGIVARPKVVPLAASALSGMRKE